MTSGPGKWRRWLLPALLLAGLALRLLFMQISLERLPVTSDEAMVVLQAKMIARGDRPLLFLAQPYQFPLGAYLMSPLVEWLPRTPLGARGPALGLGLLSFLGLWLLMTRLGPASRTWPGLLLLALPSSYLLMHQAAYPVPQYDLMLALWWLAAWLGLLMWDRPPLAALGLAALLGLTCGLALSVHLLALSLLAPLALAACLGGGWKRALARAGALGVGLALGLLPLLLAQWAYPGAAQEVSGTSHLGEIFRLDKLEVLNHAMAGALGAFSCTFPDFQRNVSLGAWAEHLMPAGFALLLLACGAVSLRALGQGRGARPRPDQPAPGYQAVFAAAPWLGLALFLLNERADSGQYRYLLVLAWCLPFLLVQLYAAAGRWSRVWLGGLAVALAAVNLLTSCALMGGWTRPGFAEQHAHMDDLAPVMAHLREHGITHCFAAYWTAYRITFQSDERILCSQPVNERFPGWPVPYKDQVRQDPRAAYVLLRSDSFAAATFENDLEAISVMSSKTVAGAYRVYQGFRSLDQDDKVPAAQISVRASHQQDLAVQLNDGDPASRWTTGQPQRPGMWLEVRLSEPRPLHRVTMSYNARPDDFPQGLRLLYRQGEQWRVLEQGLRTATVGFVFRDQLPVYGASTQELRFPATLTDGLRLEITGANLDPDRYWSISELELFSAPQTLGP